jgi:hypothetical protein
MEYLEGRGRGGKRKRGKEYTKKGRKEERMEGRKDGSHIIKEGKMKERNTEWQERTKEDEGRKDRIGRKMKEGRKEGGIEGRKEERKKEGRKKERRNIRQRGAVVLVHAEHPSDARHCQVLKNNSKKRPKFRKKHPYSQNNVGTNISQ